MVKPEGSDMKPGHIGLGPVTLNDLRQIARWRNEDIKPFRTPRYLTDRDQERYFDRLATDNTIRTYGIFQETFVVDETRVCR